MSSRRYVPFLVLLAFVLRAGYGLTQGSDVKWPDEGVYWDMAKDFAHRGTYTHPTGAPPRVTQYPPVWPLFLGVLYFAGVRDLWEIRLLLAAIGVLGCLGVAAAAREAARAVTPEREEEAGVAALALAAISPSSIYYSGYLLIETLFVACLAWLLWAALRWARDTAPRPSAELAFLLALSSLVKSVLYPLVALSLAGVVAAAVLRRVPAKSAGVFLLTIFLVWAPWLGRNYLVSGSPSFTAQGGYTLYEANNPRADGGPRPPGTVWEVEERTRHWEEHAKSRAFRDEAVGWIKSHPGDFLLLALRKIRRLWSIVPNNADLASSRLVWWVSLLWNGPLFLAAAYGIWRVRRSFRLLWPIAVIPLFVTVIHAVFVASIRYREPAVPSLLLLAALAVLPLLPSRPRAS